MTVIAIHDGIKDFVKDNIGRFLQPVDGINVPMFKAIHKSSTFDILNFKLYPVLMMEYGRAEGERISVGSDDYTLPITFYCVSSGGDIDKLQTLSEAYVWALKRLFEYDPSAGGFADYCEVTGWEFSPMIQRNTSNVSVGLLYTNFIVKILRNKEDR